ncbi:MAG: hypothetical protein AB1430_14245 [Pseudomonadota bacterium]
MARMLQGCVLALATAVASSSAALELPPDDHDRRGKRHQDAAQGLDAAVASLRERLPDGRTRLTYNVCNLSPRKLSFQWPKPGFESGIAHPLKTKTCAVYVRDVLESALDDDARLLYWQTGEPRHAQAFLGKQSPWGKARRELATWLYARGIGLGPDKPDQVKDVEIAVAEMQGLVQQQVHWAGHGMSVALRLAELDEGALAQLRSQLGGQGVLMEAEAFVKSLHPDDQKRLPGAVREGRILVLSTRNKGPVGAKFHYELGQTAPSIQPVVVLGADGRVMWVAYYATVRRH